MGKNNELKTKWYYDACTLDEKVYEKIFKKVTTGKNPIVAVLSHLALGEVYGNLFLKKGRDQMDAFTEFLASLRVNGRIEVVGNDEIEDVLERVRGVMSSERCDFTDVIHIATAMKRKCSNFLSDDRGLTGMDGGKKEKIKKIALEECEVEDFSITWLKVS